MRLFFAIPIPEEHKTKLFAAFPLRNQRGIRFTIKEQLHITVHFLGETPKEKLTAIIDAASNIAAVSKAFELEFIAFKLIQRHHKPVMIWAQMQQSEAFEKLCLQLQNTLPTEENKNPNPHITMARIKQLKQLPFELPHIKPFSFTVDCMELFESTTHPDGAIYTLIQRWKLNNA